MSINKIYGGPYQNRTGIFRVQAESSPIKLRAHFCSLSRAAAVPGQIKASDEPTLITLLAEQQVPEQV